MSELSYLGDTVARQSRVAMIENEILIQMALADPSAELPDWYRNGGELIIHCETDNCPSSEHLKSMIHSLAGHLDFKNRGVKNLCYGYFKDIPDTSGKKTSAWLIGIEMGGVNG